MAKKGNVRQEPEDREAVAQRAYELFVKRGSAPGREVDDWLEAEQQLRRERRPRTAKAEAQAPEPHDRGTTLHSRKQTSP